MSLLRPRPGARRARRPQAARALAGAAALLACAWASPAAARAEACPGAGAAPCPYATASVVGQRAEGVLRFPEAVALDASGNVYVADQLSYVVQKFTPAGTFETEWGSYGGGHRQFGPIGGLATTRRATSTSSTRATTGSRSSPPTARSSPSGATRAPSRGSSVRLLPRLHQAPGGGIAVAGPLRVRGGLGQQPHPALQPQGGEPMPWGTKGSGPGQFRYPRGVAANASEVLVADDDNHRIEKFDPEGAYRARRARRARARASSPSPTASRSTRRATRTSRTTSATAS